MIRPLVFIFISTAFAQDAYEGDVCSLSNGASGVCKVVKNCPVVSQEIKAGNLPDKLCGWSGLDPIVCCPTSSPLNTPGNRVVTEKPTGDGRGAIARQKCTEYAKFVWTLKYPPVSIGRPKPINDSECAIGSQKLIVGGKKAEPKEFPHMAAIGYVPSGQEILWRCGGTLISENFVLTAAHCVRPSRLGNARWVRLGDNQLKRSSGEDTHVDIQVTERLRHPQYKLPSQYHDIGLLRLGSRVQFNGWIRPACLHTAPTTGTEKAIATGWGHVEWAADSGSNNLLKVTLPLVSQETCSKAYPSNTRDNTLRDGIFEDRMMCAGEVGSDTCQGDSGGPLVVYNLENYCMYDVVGVTSLGKLCGQSIPGVYSRVYYYLNWIESVVWN